MKVDFEQYREQFEKDFKEKHNSKLLNILRREDESYYHMEAARAWEYFKKGIEVLHQELIEARELIIELNLHGEFECDTCKKFNNLGWKIQHQDISADKHLSTLTLIHSENCKFHSPELKACQQLLQNKKEEEELKQYVEERCQIANRILETGE